MKPSLEAVVAHINEKMEVDARVNTEPKLAKLAKMSQSSINRIRNGGQDVTTAKLDLLAKALRMSAAELLSPPESKTRNALGVEQTAALYQIPSDPLRATIDDLLDGADHQGLELALHAIQNAFSMRKILAPDKVPVRSRRRAGN